MVSLIFGIEERSALLAWTMRAFAIGNSSAGIRTEAARIFAVMREKHLAATFTLPKLILSMSFGRTLAGAITSLRPITSEHYPTVGTGNLKWHHSLLTGGDRTGTVGAVAGAFLCPFYQMKGNSGG
jgi:hypothetical protein